MLKLVATGALLLTVITATVTPAHAQQPPRDSDTAAQDAVIRAAHEQQPGEGVSPALLTAIVTWLSLNFDLAPTDVLPHVQRISASDIAARRGRDLLGVHGQRSFPDHSGRETVAIYDTDEQTIYLPAGWSGHSPAEMSILVHEMVHHLQHVAGTRFACAQEREQLAYAAQQRWLGLFGRSLEGEFQLDPFTLLVTTRCLY